MQDPFAIKGNILRFQRLRPEYLIGVHYQPTTNTSYTPIRSHLGCHLLQEAFTVLPLFSAQGYVPLLSPASLHAEHTTVCDTCHWPVPRIKTYLPEGRGQI